MNKKYPLSMAPFIRSINLALKEVHKDIERLGVDEAYELFADRSDRWIRSNDQRWAGSEEEAIACVAFAAALSFINILFHTGEINNHD